MSRRRFAVVGGGIAGLAAAYDLATAGHEVLVHEAAWVGASPPPVRRSGGSPYQFFRAVCTLAPSELCAHGGPFGGDGRST